jgi:hypothetical protein
MSTTQQCTYCSALMPQKAQFCQKCGARIHLKEQLPTEHLKIKRNKKSAKIALALCILFGFLGGHRFYVGKTGTGLLALVTGGFLGLWTIIDLISIIQNKFKDKEGHSLILSYDLSLIQRLVLILGSIVSWLVLTLSALLIAASYLTQGLVATASNQLTALHKGNLKEAYAYTSAEYQKAYTFGQFKTWLSQFSELKNNKEAVFKQRGLNSYDGFLNLGFLEGTLIAQDGKEVNVKYLFIKEHGNWKILSIIPTPKK